MQNELFIDEIWAKIAVGTLSYCWNLILVVGSQFGSNLAIGSLYYHWDSNLAVRSTQTWYGPSDHVGERVDFSQKMAKKSAINWRPRRFIVNRRYIADFLAIFCEKSALRHISSKCCVAWLRYAIYRRYFATFSSLVKICELKKWKKKKKLNTKFSFLWSPSTNNHQNLSFIMIMILCYPKYKA